MSDTHIPRQHTVTCFECGRKVTDLGKTKTALREELQRLEDWTVAIPMWAAGLGRRGDPAIARKTVDCCRECMWRRCQEAVETLNNYTAWPPLRVISTKVQ